MDIAEKEESYRINQETFLAICFINIASQITILTLMLYIVVTARQNWLQRKALDQRTKY